MLTSATYRLDVDCVNIGSGPAQPYHHGDLRRALVAAARALLEESGPEALSLRDVARRVGVSHNAPYRHFPTKQALLAAVAAEEFAALSARMAAVPAAPGLGAPRGREPPGWRPGSAAISASPATSRGCSG